MLRAFATRKLSNVVPSRATARLRAFRREVEFALPGKIALVVLFGSRARGDAHKDSDYDVAVFVNDLNDRRSIDHTLADTAYRHLLAGVHIRPVAVPADYLESRPRDRLAMNIAQDGILVP
jgi:predicted nucleotidyltransferase